MAALLAIAIGFNPEAHAQDVSTVSTAQAPA
jgi:hypothetical protein